MKHVLFYESADGVATKAPAHYAAHGAHAQKSHSEGDLLLIGIFTDTQNDGAMAVFTSREAAEDFAKNDPFVTNGVVSSWRVCDWREVLDTE